ncbi:MAG TPA: hypothetical protein VIT44_09750 [Cyclobacteriaceae bacterium]
MAKFSAVDLMTNVRAVCALGLFLLLPIAGIAQADCELKKEKDNIKIYSCPLEGSALNAILVELEVNSTIEKDIPIVLDVARYGEWRYRELHHKLLKKISDTELIYYAEISAPFPLSNRDLILHLKLNRDPITKILTVKLESMPDYIPSVEDVVRISSSSTTLTLIPIGEEKLKVRCYVRVDPGGHIPAWVVNMFSTQGPYETFRNLTEKMEAK